MPLTKKLITFFLILFLPTILLAQTFSGKVVGVSDGDTITVMHNGVGEKIRFNGIDAPEKSQDFGQSAKKFVSDQCFGKAVTIESLGTDKYNRTIGNISLPDGRLLNHEVVKNGYAWWYRKYAPNDKALEKLESQAKAAKLGLWSQGNPIPPWEFRHGGAMNIEHPVATSSNGSLPIIGNKNSHIYHLPNCDSYNKVAPKNRVIFASEEQARGAGYRVAKNCN